MSAPTLVTGGAGFIGSHLCEALVARGTRVIALDDASSGCFANLDKARASGRVDCVQASACDEALVDALVRASGAVVHLACAVGVRAVLADPLRLLEGSVRAAQLVLAAAARHGRPLVLASSSEVYGLGRAQPLDELDGLAFGPTSEARWGYGCVKALAEWHALALVRERGARIAIARLFNVVGPRQRAQQGMVLPCFARAAVRGEPLRVYGDGSATRSYCHVRDAVEALVRLLERPEASGQPCNVGGVEELASLELARRVNALAGRSSSIVHVPREAALPGGLVEPQRRVPRLERARALLGWSPRIAVDVALREVVEQERALLEAAAPHAP
jgi:UDP-glucose 4-epimerase